MYNVYLQAISPIFSTITLIITYFWPRVVFQLKLWFWISISWSYLVGFAHTSILPSCPHVLSIFLLLIVTGDKKTRETVSWISLSNGLTTLTSTTTTSTCPFPTYSFEKLGSTLRSFYQDKARLKTRKSEKTKTIFKKKKVKKVEKKLPKKFKNIKSYQKKLKIN